MRERAAEEGEVRQEQAAQTEGGREFARVEELLQYDSEQNPVPPEVAERVNDTIRKEQPARQGWWQKVFGG